MKWLESTDEHAILAPSSAERWGNCLRSLHYAPDEAKSKFSLEGDLFHEIMEIAGTQRAALEMIKMSREMYDAAVQCFNYIDDVCKDLTYIQSAEEVKSGYNKAWFGTRDKEIVGKGSEGWELHIFDYKYGQNVARYAENDDQILNYMYFALEDHNDKDFVKVVGHILQPRRNNFTSWEIHPNNVYDLVQGHRLVAEAIVEYLPAENVRKEVRSWPVKAGTWCTYCPGKLSCEEHIDLHKRTTLAVLNNLPVEKTVKATKEHIVKRVEEVPLTKLIQFYEMRSLITEFQRAVKDRLTKERMKGTAIPGWKLVYGKSNRAFKGTTEKIIANLKKAGVKNPVRPITLTEAEKEVGTDALKRFTYKPTPAFTLVPTPDPREEAFGKEQLLSELTKLED